MTPLRLDSACCRQLNWRTDLPRDVDPADFERSMTAEGWTSRCRHPALAVLRHEEGHEVAWVTRSGRVQIRVDLAVPEGERPARARTVYDTLAICLGRLSGFEEVEEAAE